MKKIKIANGIKRIEDTDRNSTLFRLRDVLHEHRSILISRIMTDLVAYIDYKFKIKPASKELDSVKDALLALKNSVLDLDRYNDIVDAFFENETTHIGAEPFLKEIDEHISSTINQSQLKLV
jgi:hypothetical protein